MKKSLFFASAALLAISGAAIAQDTTTDASAPAETTTTAPADATMPEAAPEATTPTTDMGSATTPADATTAQTTAPADATAPAETQPAQSADGAAMPDAAAPAAEPAQSAQTGMPATAADPAKAQAAQQTVQADWSKYDKDNKGGLTPLEFGTWVMAANGQDMTAQVNKTRQSKSANLPAVKVLNATADAFAKADSNKDKLVSPEELTTFLSA